MIKNEKGFSLVEMVLAIIILSIIASVVFLSGQGSVNRASAASNGQQLEAIRGAVTSFYGDFRKHPCKSPVCVTGGWTDLTPEYLPNAPDTTRWNATCTDGGNLDIIVNAGDLVSATQILFQKQCSIVLTDDTAKTITCRLSTTARCP